MEIKKTTTRFVMSFKVGDRNYDFNIDALVEGDAKKQLQDDLTFIQKQLEQ